MTNLQQLQLMRGIGDHSSKGVQCTICLQKTANCSLDGCTHQFCLRCIRKWSKSKNTCPLCRESFSQLRHKKRVIKIEPRPLPTNLHSSVSHHHFQQQQRRIVYIPLVIYPQPSCFYYPSGSGLIMSPVENSSGLNYSFYSPSFFIPSA